MAEKTVNAVEEKLWSEEDGAYIDLYNGANDTLVVTINITKEKGC